MEKYKCTKTVYDCIDWEVIKQGRKGYSKRDNIRITKLMFDWVNAGHQKAKMNQEKCCPCCGAEEETLLHLFQCRDPQMEKNKNGEYCNNVKNITKH